MAKEKKSREKSGAHAKKPRTSSTLTIFVISNDFSNDPQVTPLSNVSIDLISQSPNGTVLHNSTNVNGRVTFNLVDPTYAVEVNGIHREYISGSPSTHRVYTLF